MSWLQVPTAPAHLARILSTSMFKSPGSGPQQDLVPASPHQLLLCVVHAVMLETGFETVSSESQQVRCWLRKEGEGMGDAYGLPVTSLLGSDIS